MGGNRKSANESERAILVAVQLPESSDEQTGDLMEELEALARTAGAVVVESLVQKRTSYSPATIVGAGKLDEIGRAVRDLDAALVVFDNELTAGQQERLQDHLDTKVIDRTALMLDIFARHAHTHEGRTQVELAQLSYLLPRIRGMGEELSRLGGGIGTRGPGETKLEVDRRRIRRRMRKLSRDLEQMESVRLTQRKRRQRAGLWAVTLIGYTNSGKSSLLNRLSGSSISVEDQLFSTLDSTTRRVVLPAGIPIVVSDTVGFIRKLPHELVAAFRSTLEIVKDADLLVHVIDGSRIDDLDERLRAVSRVLEDLDAEDIAELRVISKVDLLMPEEKAYLQRVFPQGVLVSNLTGEGLDELVEKMASRVPEGDLFEYRIPALRGDVIAGIYRDGVVLEEDLDRDEVLLRARISEEKASRYSEFLE